MEGWDGSFAGLVRYIYESRLSHSNGMESSAEVWSLWAGGWTCMVGDGGWMVRSGDLTVRNLLLD